MKIPRGFKLCWSDYKSMDGSLHVWFPGGLQVYVMRKDVRWKHTRMWRVWLGDLPHERIKGLTDKRFTTRQRAMRAAEDVFVPFAMLAPQMMKITTEVVVNDAFSEAELHRLEQLSKLQKRKGKRR